MKSEKEIVRQIRILEVKKDEIKKSIGDCVCDVNLKIIEGNPIGDAKDIKIIDFYISALQWVLE